MTASEKRATLAFLSSTYRSSPSNIILSAKSGRGILDECFSRFSWSEKLGRAFECLRLTRSHSSKIADISWLLEPQSIPRFYSLWLLVLLNEKVRMSEPCCSGSYRGTYVSTYAQQVDKPLRNAARRYANAALPERFPFDIFHCPLRSIRALLRHAKAGRHMPCYHS